MTPMYLMYFSFSIITAQPSKSITNTVSNVVCIVVAPIFETNYVLGKAFPGKGREGFLKSTLRLKGITQFFLCSVAVSR